MNKVLTWEDLKNYEIEDLDRVNGINNSYSNLRLFGHTENDVIVTLYRDRHSWCPIVKKYGYGLNIREFHTGLKKSICFATVKKKVGFLIKSDRGNYLQLNLKSKF